MAQTISATDVEAQKPVNAILEQTFLRRAQQLAPYFMGTQAGRIDKNKGAATIKWRRITNLTPTTTALSELTTTASYMQGRDSVAAAFTDVTATLAKYGQFYILNEEVNLFLWDPYIDELVKTLAHSAGRSLNFLQRNLAEDNLTLVYAAAAASSGAVVSKITAAEIKQVINTLANNSAETFMPMTTGDNAQGTAPILPAYWGLTHPDVAIDISALSGFRSVETYAGQTATVPGEFGTYGIAGRAVRFIQSEDATVDANAGGAVGTTGLKSTGASVIDLYTTVIYGEDALGSVGLGRRHTDGVYRAGENKGGFELIQKGLGSGGTSDPYNEIQTLAWKAWWAGAVLNAAWGRGIRSGATNLAV